MEIREVQICILGRLGGKEVLNDGQTVKTVAVYEALLKQGINIEKVDTYYIHKNILKFGWQFFKSIFTCKKYIVLVSINGRRLLFPILSFMGRFLKKDIYHYAIGGRLADEVKSGVQPVARLNTFRANWVESETIVRRLNNLGVTNAKYIPNFKNITPINEQDIKTSFQEPYRFCTFSRVMKEKGISDAANAIKSINEEFGRTVVKLDIYGPIDDAYKAEFESILADEGAVKYCGIIPTNESVEVLKNYFMLLFPTHFKHEGIPGTIIDALCAGLPIIARKWAYCDEMIEDGVNGYVYDFNKSELLKEKIIYAFSNQNQTIAMRRNCLRSAKKYRRSKVIEQIRHDMGI